MSTGGYEQKTNMKILITTPSGRIGRRIVPELLAPEFAVRVVSPNPDRLPPEICEQIEIVRGAMDDPKALREALDGVDALFWCVPPPSPDETSIRGYYERFARAASRAIRQAGTPRVVAICESREAIAAEPLLNESGAAIRHLRCGLPSAEVADLALRLLVRSDWDGVEAVTVQSQLGTVLMC